MKTIVRYIIMLVPAVLQSCVDPISFETDPGGRQLVFYGIFTQMNEEHIFTIFYTSDFGKQGIPVSGASIVIKDEQDNCADYEEYEPGKYVLAPDKMPGIPGRSYHIEIILANGRTYYSLPQVLPQPIEAREIYYKIETRQTLSGSEIIINKIFIDIYIDTPLRNSSGESLPLRWTVDEVYSFTDLQCHPLDLPETCYFNVPVDESKVRLFKNEEGVQKDLKEYNVYSRLLSPSEFLGRHYFNVRQYSISGETYKYWEEIKIVANQSGSIFDVQPATVRGNMYEKDNEQAFVFGYFEVSGQNIVRTFTSPSLIASWNIVSPCNGFIPYYNNANECCFCWLWDDNIVERPAYWGDDF